MTRGCEGVRGWPGVEDEQGGCARPVRALRRDPRGRRHRQQGHRHIQGRGFVTFWEAEAAIRACFGPYR